MQRDNESKYISNVSFYFIFKIKWSPYCSDFNTIEKVQRNIKRNLVTRTYKDIKSLKEDILDHEII